MKLEALLGFLLALLFASLLVAYFVVLIKYANTPIGELPNWVYWLLYNKGGSK